MVPRYPAGMEIQRRISQRRYLGPDERRRVAERFESGGLTRREFAKRHRISLSSLNRWLAEARHASGVEHPVVFHEVAVSPPIPPAVPMDWAVELTSPDGISIRCRESLSVHDLARLLRGGAC